MPPAAARATLHMRVALLPVLLAGLVAGAAIGWFPARIGTAAIGVELREHFIVYNADTRHDVHALLVLEAAL